MWDGDVEFTRLKFEFMINLLCIAIDEARNTLKGVVELL